jgi:hypothetical protein
MIVYSELQELVRKKLYTFSSFVWKTEWLDDIRTLFFQDTSENSYA